MKACLDAGAILRAPSMEKAMLTGSGLLYLLASYLAAGGEAVGEAVGDTVGADASVFDFLNVDLDAMSTFLSDLFSKL